MTRAAARRPAHAGFRGVPALLVAVVALLCVFGHAERGGPGTHPSVAQQVHAPTVSLKPVADEATTRLDAALSALAAT
ncbi:MULTISPECIES: hypothetical protein [Streptomyces]|uniref:Uncharacterized protein n=1 Tax=Streptomyces lycii TaxID=2654337 RepID=A0ABQ7FMZ5_9ACTN|nr:hypothetical protein [Streptomyces lycii]KAF4408994.1 hypothetical protein GCU69_11235 [Streptomyces lycii]